MEPNFITRILKDWTESNPGATEGEISRELDWYRLMAGVHPDSFYEALDGAVGQAMERQEGRA